MMMNNYDSKGDLGEDDHGKDNNNKDKHNEDNHNKYNQNKEKENRFINYLLGFPLNRTLGRFSLVFAISVKKNVCPLC